MAAPPTPDEMRNLVEDKVREEILYREGFALGLDRSDTIMKRRLAQKMDFLAAAGTTQLRLILLARQPNNLKNHRKGSQ